MNTAGEKKEENWFVDLRKIIPKFALILSSSFYVALLLIAILARSQIYNGLLLVNLAMLILYFSFLFKKNEKSRSAVLLIGSMSYFCFLLSFLFGFNFFGVVYVQYGKVLELIINQVLLGATIYVLVILLIALLFLKIYFIMSDKIKSKLVLEIIASLFIILFFFLLKIDDFFPKLKIMGYFMDKSKYLVPFIGFSLAYLHGKFLLFKAISFFPDSR